MNDEGLKVLLRADLCSTLFGGCYNTEHQKCSSVLYSASWETLYGNIAGSDTTTTPCLQLEIVAVERGRRKYSYNDRRSYMQMFPGNFVCLCCASFYQLDKVVVADAC